MERALTQTLPAPELAPTGTTAPLEGRARVVIEAVTPEVDCGRFPAKATLGETVTVEADAFADGHDLIACSVLYRHVDEPEWRETPMAALVNDRWRGTFTVEEIGEYRFTVRGWVDHFASWRRDLRKRVDAQQHQEVALALRTGARLVAEAATRATGPDRGRLETWSAYLDVGPPDAERLEVALGDDLAAAVGADPDLRFATSYERELRVRVDRERARFSTWYELFPRSHAEQPGEHGTLRDIERLLPYVAGMGFDVLYLPPISPIGRSFRKGPNNTLTPSPTDPGVPWAIGSHEGGHTAVHPELGTLDDVRSLITAAQAQGIEVALDIAFQCSPDHPWVKEHPDWFRARPDETIQYAENPPKKYQDIYPIDFESTDWRNLWEALTDVFRTWNRLGVRIFRVDNPHTKAFPFWEHCIAEIQAEDPGAVFLAEAFTRPKVMYRLAKLGFTQSYTYFAWRTGKAELIEYFTELTQGPPASFFRPNLWPNTPDILTEQLQTGGRPTFLQRLVLAATLGASYGIYGPAFELMEHTPREHGSEEYLDSEKYQIRAWELDDPRSLRYSIAEINGIRRANPALQTDRGLRFHAIDNDQLLCYSKVSFDGRNVVLVVVNLDPRWRQSGWTDLSLAELGLSEGESFRVRDLLTAETYTWAGRRNYVELDPSEMPAHIFLVQPEPRPGASRRTVVTGPLA